MWEKLKSIFLFNGFDPDVIRSIKGDLVEVTCTGLSKLSLGLVILYAIGVFTGLTTDNVKSYTLYLATIILFQGCLLLFRKTGKMGYEILGIVLFIICMLSVAIYDSTWLCQNSIGIFFPVYLLLFAVMFTGNPIVIDVIMLGMTILFCVESHSAKPVEYFHRDVFSTGFVLLISNMLNAMVARSRISAIVKTKEVEESRKKYAEMVEIYKTLYNNVPCGIMEYKVSPEASQVISINNQGMIIYGWEKSEVEYAKDTLLPDLAHPDDKKIVEKALAKLNNVGDQANYECRLKRQNGTYVWVVVQSTVTASDDNEKVILSACVNIDAEKKAIDASEAKSIFMSRMSHDMRTPMNGILGLTALSKDENDIKVLKQNLNKIDESGKYLLEIINDTLDVQRIESGKMSIHLEPTSSKSAIENAIDLVRPGIAKKNLDFQVVNKGIDMDCKVMIDPVRIKQVFVNLISNAIKFTPEGGKISFECECIGRDGKIAHDRFIVRDTGVGMTKDFIENQLFAPYAQEANEFTTQYSGSGLGLSIVKKLLDLMGATIEVESEIGKGTAFIIDIDFEHADENTIPSEQKVDQDNNWDSLKGCKILLTEDHPLNAEIAKKLLNKVGCTTTWVKNGQESVDTMSHFEPGQFDAILMDLRMPVMDGLTAAKTIRSLDVEGAKTIPIIAMTANAYAEDVENCMKVGMNAHISKPVDPKVLYDTLVSFVSKTE